MSAATTSHYTTKNHRRRKEIKQQLNHTINTSRFIILALFTSFCGGRLSVGGAGQRFFASGGLLRRIVGTLPQEEFRERPSSSSSGAVYGSAFVSAVPLTPSFSRSSSSHDKAMESSAKPPSTATDDEIKPESCSENENNQQQQATIPSKVTHPDDPSLWLYHVETTTSTMDEAKRIVEKKFMDDANNHSTSDDDTMPTSFLISATSQSNGRGTTQRDWKSAKKGNALFTVGIPQSSWMKDLKSKNDGKMVPLTLLPLKIGSLVAFHVQKVLGECVAPSGETQQIMPAVTVKWPNDVLLHSSQGSHQKIAGILIESAQDWFLVGIGINVGYAPSIPSDGANHGRKATCLSQYCSAATAEGGEEADTIAEEEYWIKVSNKLAIDIAHDLHSWLHPLSLSPSFVNVHSGESILDQWKSYIDWDMELTMRDTPKRERVKLKAILVDGRVVVQDVETGLTRTLVSDYFL